MLITIGSCIPIEILRQSVNITQFRCLFCSLNFEIENLEKHITGKNRCALRGGDDHISIVCPEENCKYKKAFKKIKHLRQHFNICHEFKEFHCGTCRSQFHESQSLRKMLKSYYMYKISTFRIFFIKLKPYKLMSLRILSKKRLLTLKFAKMNFKHFFPDQ